PQVVINRDGYSTRTQRPREMWLLEDGHLRRANLAVRFTAVSRKLWLKVKVTDEEDNHQDKIYIPPGIEVHYHRNQPNWLTLGADLSPVVTQHFGMLNPRWRLVSQGSRRYRSENRQGVKQLHPTWWVMSRSLQLVKVYDYPVEEVNLLLIPSD